MSKNTNLLHDHAISSSFLSHVTGILAQEVVKDSSWICEEIKSLEQLPILDLTETCAKAENYLRKVNHDVNKFRNQSKRLETFLLTKVHLN